MELRAALGGVVPPSLSWVLALLGFIACDVRPLLLLLLEPSVRVYTSLIAISRLTLSESGFCDAGLLARSHMFPRQVCSALRVGIRGFERWHALEARRVFIRIDVTTNKRTARSLRRAITALRISAEEIIYIPPESTVTIIIFMRRHKGDRLSISIPCRPRSQTIACVHINPRRGLLL